MCTTPPTNHPDIRTPHGASKPAESHQGLRRVSHGSTRLAACRLLSAGFLASLGGLLVLTTAAGAATRYVNVNNAAPAPPYTTWATAATKIQDAVDVAATGDEILVTNGVYQTGARAVDGGTSNRLAVTKPVTVRSVNGPSVTQIVGWQVPGTRNGPAAVRCVYLTNGAVLAGFTLTNGATGVNGSGGGVWCEGETAIVSNCVLTGNSASDGGGVYQGTLNHCTLTGNSASYAGGGARWSRLNHCTLTGNTASVGGGGVAEGTLNNCTLTGNSSFMGGGAFWSGLNNCTLTGNSADEGGGANGWPLNNCIVYGNTARSGPNYLYSALNYCCTTPLPADGVGNITNAPLFVDYARGNLRLQATSPCINAGGNAYAPGSSDLDGLPRIVSGTVDMGAYEFQPPLTIVRQPLTQTAELGSVAGFRVWLTNAGPGTVCQWYFSGTPLAGATNTSLKLADAQAAQIGTYTVVVSNAYGAVTSAPALLNVIPAVPRRTVAAVYLTGDLGTLLHLDYADTVAPAPAWQALTTLTLTNPPQLWLDLTDPMPATRFYRVWQADTPSVLPVLDLELATELTLTGTPGTNLRVDYINRFGPVDAWVALATVTLTSPNQIYVDLTMFRQPPRLYRLVRVP
jgi:parallel beta-helix repeat protein